MPYFRITCPELRPEKMRAVATRLTDEASRLFANPHVTSEELRSRTTVQFVSYSDDQLFIGGQTPVERQSADVTLEVSDWGMSVKQQAKVASALTPVVAELFEIANLDNINFRFHSYPPTDFAVGGRLLSQTIPAIATIRKRLLG
jgi:phenylpyruvate tautomerase PptA (4-oxalocrotonate tautomerase family)